NRVLCHRVTTTAPTLYFKLGKVEFKYLFPRCARLRKLYEYRLRFPIRIAGNVVDLRILVWRCYVIFLITRNTRHCKSLGEGLAGCTIRVYDVVDHPIVALLPDAGVQDILTHKHLLLDTGNPRLPILADYDNVVQLGAVADVLVATQPPACKAVCPIHVELLVGSNNFRCCNGLEALNFSTALTTLPVLLEQVVEIRDGVVGQMTEIMLGGLELIFEVLQHFVRLERVVLRNTFDLDLGQFNDVVSRYLPIKLLFVGLQAFIDRFNDLFPGLAFLDISINPFLDKNLLQGGKQNFFLQFPFENLKLLFEKIQGIIRIVLQNLIYPHEPRLVLNDHARVRGNGNFAISKCIQSVYCNFRRLSRLQIDHNLNILRRVVHHLPNLDLTLLTRFYDRFD